MADKDYTSLLGKSSGSSWGEIAGAYLSGGRKKDNRARNVMLATLFFNAKEANMQATIEQVRGMTEDQFTKKYSEMYEGKTSKIYNDIKNGDMTEDAKWHIFNRLTAVQPVGLSQMPAKFLDMKNGRIFYTLRSYQIKQLSSLRKQAVKAIKGETREERIEGFKSLVTLGLLLVLANAGTDELKEFFSGRDEAFSDTVIDNILKLGMTNRYTMSSRSKSTIAGTIWDDFVSAPPLLGVGNAVGKDLWNLISSSENTYSSLQYVPGVGKLAYGFSPEKRKKVYALNKKDVMDDLKKSVRTGKGYNKVRKSISRYNRSVPFDQRITSKAIRSAKTRERNKIRKER